MERSQESLVYVKTDFPAPGCIQWAWHKSVTPSFQFFRWGNNFPILLLMFTLMCSSSAAIVASTLGCVTRCVFLALGWSYISVARCTHRGHVAALELRLPWQSELSASGCWSCPVWVLPPALWALDHTVGQSFNWLLQDYRLTFGVELCISELAS